MEFDDGDDDKDDDNVFASLVSDKNASNVKLDPVVVQEETVAIANYVASAEISSSARLLEQFQPSIQPMWTCGNTH